jgi:hypothetical protein
MTIRSGDQLSMALKAAALSILPIGFACGQVCYQFADAAPTKAPTYNATLSLASIPASLTGAPAGGGGNSYGMARWVGRTSIFRSTRIPPIYLPVSFPMAPYGNSPASERVEPGVRMGLLGTLHVVGFPDGESPFRFLT